MGQSTTIACPIDWDLSFFTRLLESHAREAGAILSNFDDQIQLVARDRAWSIVVTELSERDSAATEYASNDELDARFREELGGLRFFVVRFDDFDIARKVLRDVAREAAQTGGSAWIDTDYGWVIHVFEFLAETDRDPRWDWRIPKKP